MTPIPRNRDAPSNDGWLVAAGVAYPFAVLIAFSYGRMGPLAFHPLSLPIPAILLAIAAIALRKRLGFRTWAIAAFIAWLCLMVFAQWLIFAQAAASV